MTRTRIIEMHRLWIIGLLLWAAGPGAVAEESRAEIKDACTDLVLDYAYYRDRPDADGFADLFTHDGILNVLGQEFVGRLAIGERLRQQGDGSVFRHMMSTIRIFVEDDDHATGVSYVAVYSGGSGPGPSVLAPPLAVGEYHDEFVRTGEGWKIHRRTLMPVFVTAP